jgi:hypothetical protein
VDSKQHGLASMACLGSLAAAQRHRSTSVRRQRSKPVRPTALLSYLEGSIVEPPSTVQETRVGEYSRRRVQQKEEFMPIQALAFASSRVRGAVARCDSDVLRRQRPGSNQEPRRSATPRASLAVPVSRRIDES